MTPRVPPSNRRVVYDRARVPVGRLLPTGSLDDVATTRLLDIELSEQARTLLGTTEQTVRIPSRFVDALERDGVRLTSTIQGLRCVLLGPP